MALTRIQLANNQAMDSGLYTFPINPTAYSLQDSILQAQMVSVDGNPIFQKAKYDNRERKLTFKRWRITGGTGIHTTFATQLATLRTYVGSEKYIDFNTTATPGSDLADGAKKIYISDVRTSTVQDIGDHKYEVVEFCFIVLETQ